MVSLVVFIFLAFLLSGILELSWHLKVTDKTLGAWRDFKESTKALSNYDSNKMAEILNNLTT